MIHSKVKREVVAEHLARYRLATGGSFPEQVQRLEAHLRVLAVGNRIRLSHCDLCDGYGDSALPCCPFCGDAAPVDGVVDAESQEIEVVPVEAPAVSKLDGVLDELHRCARTHWQNLYRTGRLLKQIRDEELWRDRVDQHGLSIYKGYLEFVAKEVGIQQAYATRLVGVVEKFSEAEVGRWGIQRLTVAGRLPPAQRTKFLEDTAHLPARELPAATRSNMEGWPKMTGKTVVTKVPLGRVLARMYAKPKPSVSERVGVPTEDAVSIEQHPWTMVELPGDLWARIEIQRAPDGSGALVAAVSFRQGVPLVRGKGTT